MQSRVDGSQLIIRFGGGPIFSTLLRGHRERMSQQWWLTLHVWFTFCSDSACHCKVAVWGGRVVLTANPMRLNGVILSLSVNFCDSFTLAIFLKTFAFIPFEFFSKKIHPGVVSRVFVEKSKPMHFQSIYTCSIVTSQPIVMRRRNHELLCFGFSNKYQYR